MVSLDRFDTFKAVVEAGSLTAAADLLGQTRAVVSFNIKRLEAELGQLSTTVQTTLLKFLHYDHFHHPNTAF